jgi:hypothetical protein
MGCTPGWIVKQAIYFPTFPYPMMPYEKYPYIKNEPYAQS